MKITVDKGCLFWYINRAFRNTACSAGTEKDLKKKIKKCLTKRFEYDTIIKRSKESTKYGGVKPPEKN